MKKLRKAFLLTTPACTCAARSKVIRSSRTPGFICWKHTNMQISSKPVVQACDDFEILMHTSKEEKIIFKFLFLQFTLWLVGKIEWNIHTMTGSRNFHIYIHLIGTVEFTPFWGYLQLYYPVTCENIKCYSHIKIITWMKSYNLFNDLLPLTCNPHVWPWQNFSLQNQYNIKKTSDGNKEKY